MTLASILEWYGAIAGVVAALVVASDISTRATGWAFVLFVTASIALIAWSMLEGDAAGVGWQNVCLALINVWGVYRYLLRPGRQKRGSEAAAGTAGSAP